MKIKTLWPEKLLTDTYPDIDNKIIERIIRRQFKKTDMSYRWDCNIDSSMDYQTRFFDVLESSSSQEEAIALTKLHHQIQETAEIFAEEIGIDGDIAYIKMTEAFFNIGAPGSFQEFHHHRPQSEISCVYYVNADPDTGALVLEDPAGKSKMGWWLDDTNPDERERIDPESGSVRFFRSHVSHQVNINNTQKDRISIACNFHIVRTQQGQGFKNKV